MSRISAGAGFTIVEILVSLLLFSVIIVAILPPLTTHFGMSRASEDTLSDSAILQRVAEGLQRQWSDRTDANPADTSKETRGQFRLRHACIDTTAMVIPDGVTVTLVDLTPGATGSFTASTAYSLAATCGAERPTGTVRQVTLAFDNPSEKPSRITLEFF
ncbi:Putative pilus assembly protein [Deinococcus deserti]|uniref:Putative pilus assembly protein n=1 Tax=Deinococcus deserti (strain DSM 17065 / CIP 109153 / LMG 22923 / VCD115) TaxID=546414 RepID=C1CXY8_DEIDV|nr:putative pilus assembly protein [Deinococcus deserti VCD115]